MSEPHDCRRDGCAVGEPCDLDGGARVPASYRRDPDDDAPKVKPVSWLHVEDFVLDRSGGG